LLHFEGNQLARKVPEFFKAVTLILIVLCIEKFLSFKKKAFYQPIGILIHALLFYDNCMNGHFIKMNEKPGMSCVSSESPVVLFSTLTIISIE
jgi:hypothetical protein